MLSGHEHEPGLTLERFYTIAANGRPSDIDAALRRFPASARIRNPIAIGLRAMKSITGGDLPGGLALLRRAVTHSEGRMRQYLLELFIPLLINTHQIDDAHEALEAADGSVPELAPAFAALRAVVAARRGDDMASAWFAREALATGRAVDNPLLVGKVLLRTALAAFYREDFDEAQDRALEAARWSEGLESHRNAAIAYSILYIIAHDWVGDPDVARFYARRMAMSAHLGEDVSMENWGVLAQFDIAAEAGDSRRLRSLRGRLLAHPLNEQYYRERFSYTISEVLAQGWSGRFDVARVALTSLRHTDALSLPERSLCDALLGIVALSTWHRDLARRLTRRVISQTAERSGKEPLFDARRRRVARILASAVCIVLGDIIRGRRALSRSVDPEQRFASIVDAAGMDEERTPAMMLGYAKFLNEACRAAALARPSHGLTGTELEILKALPAGTTLAMIASSLGKSKKTVERQVGNIYAKLHVANRTQAVQRARDLGIYA
ncbi:MAG: helix-turn-helix domain-containing protein [Candidatus Eremiobacteraeota bacterium]|nr:helix-turn-helix domain-containing protein [Candidatus Eremiobacteraeota bacterium]